jgi:hypothetical protein
MATTGYRRPLADADGQCCALCTTGINSFRQSPPGITGLLRVYIQWIPTYAAGFHRTLLDVFQLALPR